MTITGIVMAGGQSLRMGTDKALVELQGRTLVEHAISLLAKFTSSIVISSNNEKLGIFGFPVIEDAYSHIGPVSGLYSALNASPSDVNIVLPCDTPCVDVSLYQTVLESASRFEAVVAGTSDGLIEPLIGFYHRSVSHILKEQIVQGNYKLHSALERMNARIEMFADKRIFLNINTRSDLITASGPAYNGVRIEDSLSA